MNSQNVILKITPNSENLPIKEYYDGLPDPRKVPKGSLTPRLQLLTAISEIVRKPVGSVRRWVYGTAKPNYLEKQAIANLLECDVESLFPES